MAGDFTERDLLRRRRRARAEAATYPTGYAKPPEEHQFKKGNTRASRVGRSDHPSLLERTLALAAEKVAVIDARGRRRWLTQDEAIRRRMGQDAMRGEPRARAEWFKQMKEGERQQIEALRQGVQTRARASSVREKIERMVRAWEEEQAAAEAARRTALEGENATTGRDHGEHEGEPPAGGAPPSSDNPS